MKPMLLVGAVVCALVTAAPALAKDRQSASRSGLTVQVGSVSGSHLGGNQSAREHRRARVRRVELPELVGTAELRACSASSGTPASEGSGSQVDLAVARHRTGRNSRRLPGDRRRDARQREHAHLRARQLHHHQRRTAVRRHLRQQPPAPARARPVTRPATQSVGTAQVGTADVSPAIAAETPSTRTRPSACSPTAPPPTADSSPAAPPPQPPAPAGTGPDR